ncbi:hypothetical protein L1049_004289 [Liquidambar formosana]|uniref:Protein kinase domain-containing protein n=1 Tax=Liquidambar formosana TaxID=63359 RepID=A0AAP0RSM9_LIQFO
MAFSVADSEALLKLKKSMENTEALNSWEPGSPPCTGKIHWDGLICYDGIVTGLHLKGMGLSGEIDVDALLEMPGLRTLSFLNNSFSGSIPEFNRLGALKAIYLSGNQFSGKISSDYFTTMGSLKKVWLSENKFTGEIPSSLAQLPHIIELHIENNGFSGTLPAFDQPKLKSLNVSNNKLEGQIPASLSKFHASSFAGNPGLCGEELGIDCVAKKNSTVSNSNEAKKHDEIAAGFMTLALVLLSLTILAIVVMRQRQKRFDELGQDYNINDETVKVHVSGSSRKDMPSSRKSTGSSRKSTGSSRNGSSHGKGGGLVGDLVVVNDEKGTFGLSELMTAAAEVLGNGGLGSSYKAMLSNGVSVVVKRLREMNRKGREGFEAEMKRLGRLRHCNILTPLGFHYRKEEKLLVYQFIPKGSLLYLLHGDRGPSHADLDWPARLKIVHGIAQGLGYLHTELATYKLPHGNLKSSNVLLGSDNEPLLADYGFSPLINANQTAQALFAYKAPEAIKYRQVSPKCDVYCLGIVILEILTGKFPSQYLNNGKGGTDLVEWVVSAMAEGRQSELFDPEITTCKNSLGEMERLLHIGAACTESNPEQRLDMREAIRRIEEIHIEGGQEAKTIHMLPSLRDGYADAELSASQSRVISSREGYGEQSGRSNSFEYPSGRRNGDSFVFAIS